MQDGAGKPDRLGEFGIAMQGIAVTRQGVEQRLVGTGVAFLHQVRRAFGNVVRLRSALRLAAEAAIAAGKDRPAVCRREQSPLSPMRVNRVTATTMTMIQHI